MEKNKFGQYFTPHSMASFMVSLLSAKKEGRILEPSSGEGVFIGALEEQGYDNWSACEIDSTLIRHKNVNPISFISADFQEDFDAVIGNPPYIRWKHLECELKEELVQNSLWKENFNSLCDYLFIFIAKSIMLLKEGGELIFICSDYWLSSTNGKYLRQFLLKHGYFHSIYQYKETAIFPRVTASLVVFRFIKNSSFKPTTCFLFTYKGSAYPSFSLLSDLSSYEKLEIPQFCNSDKWLLASIDEQKKIRQFELACSNQEGLFPEDRKIDRIGDFFDIGNGLVSGLDKAFNVTNIFHLIPEEERRCLINVVKSKNISSFVPTNISKYIYIEDKEITEQEMKSRYNVLYTHLLQFYETLQQRYQYGRKIDFWSFSFPRNKHLFSTNVDKIFVPCKDRISKRKAFRFCIAPKGTYPLQDVTALIRRPNCKESLEYAVAYLNSPEVYEWLLLNGIIKGEIVEFSEAPLASIPYRKIDWGNPYEVQIHNEISNVVKGIILKSSISEIEQRSINQLFQKLI